MLRSEIYKKHGLIYTKRQQGVERTSRRTNRIDPKRVLQRKKDCFKTNGLKSVPQNKKLIITDWSYRYSNSEPKLYEQLIQDGFELFIVKDGKLVKIQKISDIKPMLCDIEPTSQDQIKKAYLEHKLTADSVQELDYIKTRQLLPEFAEDPNMEIPSANPGYFAFNDVMKVDEKNFKIILDELKNNNELEGIELDKEFDNLDKYLNLFLQTCRPKKIKFSDHAYKKFAPHLLYGSISQQIDLTELIFENCELKISDLNKLFTKYPNLKSLKFINCKFDRALAEEKFPQLQKLEILNSKKIKTKLTKFPLKHFPNLTHLSYDDTDTTSIDISTTNSLKQIKLKIASDLKTPLKEVFHNLENANILNEDDFSFKSISSCDRLEKLRINMQIKKEDVIEQLSCTKLTALELHEVKTNCDDNTLIKVLSHFPKLQELKIYATEEPNDDAIDTDIVEDKSQLPSLQKLHCTCKTKSFITHLLRSSPDLEELIIDELLSVEKKQSDFPKLSSLKKLSWNAFRLINLENLNQLIGTNNTLDELTLTNDEYAEVNIQLLGKLTAQSSHLSSLNLSEIGLDKEQLLSLFNNFPNLKNLKLEFIDILDDTDDSLDIFNILDQNTITLPNVDKLYYRSPNSPNPTTLDKVCPNLIELEIVDSWFDISIGLPKLKTLVIRDIKEFDVEAFNKILQLCPNLEILEIHNCKFDFSKFKEKTNTPLPLLQLKKLIINCEQDTEILKNFIGSTPNSKSPYPELSAKVIEEDDSEIALKDAGNELLDNATDEKSSDVSFKLKTYFLPKKGCPHPGRYRLNTSHYRLCENQKPYEKKDPELIPENKLPPFKKGQRRYYDENQYHIDDIHFFGRKTILMEPGEYYRLPSISANDVLEFFPESNVPIDLYYSEEDNFYYVSLKEEIEYAQRAHIQYIIKSCNNYLEDLVEINKPNGLEIGSLHPMNWLDDTSELDSKLDSKLDESLNFSELIRLKENAEGEVKVEFSYPLDKLAKKEPFSFLLKFSKFIVDKFKRENVQAEFGAELLDEILRETTGYCRHRCALFREVADALGIKNRIINTGSHNEMEIFDSNHPELGWVKVNLGGYKDDNGPNEIESYSDTPIPENLQDQLETTAAELKQTSEKDETIEEKKCENITDYIEWLEQKLSEQTLNKNMLLVFDNENQIFQFKAALLNYQKQKKRQLHMVHHLDDISDKDYIDDPEGKSVEEDSTLSRFLHSSKPNDMLLLDWSKFKQEDMGNNTANDDERTLHQMPLKNDLIHIDVILSSRLNDVSDDYGSRHSYVAKFPSHLERPTTSSNGPARLALPADCYNGMVEFIEADAKADGIQLYHEDDFEDNLVGVRNGPGKLINLLSKLNVPKDGKDEKSDNAPEIVLINVPNTPLFKTFLFDLTQNKKIRFNGKDYPLPENVRIKIMERPYAFKGNYSIRPGLSPKDADIPLNSETYSYFFDCDHETPKVDDLLRQYAQKKLSLYIKEADLVEDQLAKLIEEANVHNVFLDFIHDSAIKLPEAMIKNSKVPETLSFEDPEEKQQPDSEVDSDIIMSSSKQKAIEVFFSSDVEPAVSKIASTKKFDCIYSVDASKTYNDLFDVLDLERSMHSLDINIKHHIGTIAKLLLENKSVLLIAKGGMSPELAKHLETLFTKQPFLFIGNERKKVTGQLTIVSDDKNLFSFANNNVTIIPSVQSQEQEEKKDVPVSEPKPTIIQVEEALQKHRLVVLDAPTAFGKTPLIDKIGSKYRRFNGLEQFEDWVLAEGPDAHLLVIEDADLELEGSFEFIKNLFDPEPGFFDRKGQWKAIPPNKKIIVSVDSCDTLYHKIHKVFKDHGIIIPLPEPDYLNEILLPLLKEHCPFIPEESRNNIAKDFLKYFKFGKEEYKLDLTGRNLEDMVQRLLVFKDFDNAFRNPEQPLDPNVLLKKVNMVIYDELHGLMTKEQRLNLKQKLFGQKTQYNQIKLALLKANYLKKKENSMDLGEDKTSDDYTQTRQKLWSQLDIFLQIHPPKKLSSSSKEVKKDQPSSSMDVSTDEIKSPVPKIGLRGILIEGPSGIGKSRVVLKFLKSKGLVKGVDFYHITPTNTDKMREVLTKASRENKIVVIDEINILDPLFKLIKNSTCPIIGTMNDASLKNRLAPPRWMKNRFQCLRLNNYKEKELIKIIVDKGMNPELAKKHVEQYEKERKQKSGLLRPTPRTLFRKIDAEIENTKKKTEEATKQSTISTFSLASISETSDAKMSTPDEKSIVTDAKTTVSKKRRFEGDSSGDLAKKLKLPELSAVTNTKKRPAPSPAQATEDSKTDERRVKQKTTQFA